MDRHSMDTHHLFQLTLGAFVEKQRTDQGFFFFAQLM